LREVCPLFARIVTAFAPIMSFHGPVSTADAAKLVNRPSNTADGRIRSSGAGQRACLVNDVKCVAE